MSGGLPWLRMAAMLAILAALFVVPMLILYADERQKRQAATATADQPGPDLG